MAVDGVDVCWIGAGDLGKSMGIDRTTAEGSELHTAAVRRAIEACHKTNKVPGISMGTAEECQRWIDKGCLFVTAGVDRGWVLEGAEQTLRKLGRV